MTRRLTAFFCGLITLLGAYVLLYAGVGLSVLADPWGLDLYLLMYVAFSLLPLSVGLGLWYGAWRLWQQPPRPRLPPRRALRWGLLSAALVVVLGAVTTVESVVVECGVVGTPDCEVE